MFLAGLQWERCAKLASNYKFLQKRGKMVFHCLLLAVYIDLSFPLISQSPPIDTENTVSAYAILSSFCFFRFGKTFS